MDKNVHDVEALPLQTRLAPISNVDQAGRTARLTWTAGALTRRYDYMRDRNFMEELSMDPAHVRMERLQSGKAPFLNNHSSYELSDVIGVVESANGSEAVVRFSSRADVEPIFHDVKDRILRNISVGYAIYKREMIPPASPDADWIYRVIDWEPMELSLVTIPADAGAEVRGSTVEKRSQTYEVRNVTPSPLISNHKENIMPLSQNKQTKSDVEIRAEERQRCQDIQEALRVSGLEDQVELSRQYIASDLDISVIRGEVLRRMADRSDAQGIRGVASLNADANPAKPIDAMVESLFARMTGRNVSGQAQQYSGYRMVDYARDILQANGVRTTSLSPNELIVRSYASHASGDFPYLLQATGERILRQAYESYQGGLRRICRQTTARDFRAKTSIMLGEAPELLKVKELESFSAGSMAESKESYRLDTFGRIFGISRQALVNDDLNAFADVTRRLGIAASESIANQLVALLQSNPAMNDGQALFHASHRNLAAVPSAINDDSLAAARLAMRTQRGLGGKTIVDVTPRYLIVPAALENIGMKYLASLKPTAVADVNTFSGMLELVVDPRLDDLSATAWYLAADSGSIDTIEYAYLEEAQGPMIESRIGFEVDGVEMKVRMDFGAGILDFRGLYRNAGA